MTAFALSPPRVRSLPGAGRVVTALHARHATLVVGASALALVTAMAWGTRGMTFDDPGIFWRYAEHLATGAGWDYNTGQAGTANAITSPLWVLALTAGRLIGGAGSLPAVTTVLFVAFLAGAATFTFAGLRAVGHPVAGAFAALLLVTSPLVLMTRGMESALYLCLTAAALLAWVRGRDVWCGLALGALVLTRPDGALLAVALGLYAVWRRRRVPWAMASGFAVVVVPWLAYSLVRFGSIYPGTLAAKTAQGSSGLWGPLFLRGLFDVPVGFGFLWAVFLVAPVIAGLRVLLRRREADHRRESDRWCVPLAGFTALFILGYSLLRVPAGYEWYYVVPVYAVVVVAGFGLESSALSGGRRAWLAGLLTALVVMLGVHEAPTGLAPYRAGYQAAGEWLRANTPPDATVGAEEIGLIGYYSDRPIDDFSGLLSASDAKLVARGDVVSWVSRDQPDYVVDVTITGWSGLEKFAEEPWFPADFRLVYAVDQVRIYQRIARVTQA